MATVKVEALMAVCFQIVVDTVSSYNQKISSYIYLLTSYLIMMHLEAVQ
jgi:hypothetical protein